MFGVAYVITLVAGFSSNRNLKDPHLAVAELLILIMAPVMVAIAVAIHTTASADGQPYTLMSLAWMIAAAGTTSIVHFVELTVARRIDHATLPGDDRVFGWRWPSVLYAIDIVAWDIFFAHKLPALCGRRPARLRRRCRGPVLARSRARRSGRSRTVGCLSPRFCVLTCGARRQFGLDAGHRLVKPRTYRTLPCLDHRCDH